MRSFTKEEAKKHKESLKEMFEKDETEERLDMMCRMFNDTYFEALEFKHQRDELLEVVQDILHEHNYGRIVLAEDEITKKKWDKLERTYNKIEGAD